MAKDKLIKISYSSISDFLNCRRLYYFSNVLRLESIYENLNYVMGNAIHYGLQQLYSKNSKAIQNTIKEFNKIKSTLRTDLLMSKDKEQDLVETEYIIRGMLESYEKKYKKLINKITLVDNEFKLEYMINDNVQLTGRIDNILKLKEDLCVHEIKTSKYLTEDYVKNIKNDFQTHIYFHVYNMTHTQKIKKILYDVIKKPSIRKKKAETYRQFLTRLYDYYQNPNDSELFYMDEITRPLVTKEKIMNILRHVADEIRNCKVESDYYHNYKYCYVFHRCTYYEICMYGQNTLNMMNFKLKKERI